MSFSISLPEPKTECIFLIPIPPCDVPYLMRRGKRLPNQVLRNTNS
jgi:hypothetical protein